MNRWDEDSAKQTIEAVANLWGLSYEDIVGKKRYNDITMARMTIAVSLMKVAGLTTTEAGSLIARDHSTVTYYSKTLPYVMISDKSMADKVNKATAIIKKMFKRNKYGNTKVRIDGMVFDSKKEYERWLFLKKKQEEGVIENLERQVSVELIPDIYEDFEVKMKTKTKVMRRRVQRAINYTCDFRYTKFAGETVVYEDVKASPNAASLDKAFILKEKLFRYVMGFSLTRVYKATQEI